VASAAADTTFAQDDTVGRVCTYSSFVAEMRKSRSLGRHGDLVMTGVRVGPTFANGRQIWATPTSEGTAFFTTETRRHREEASNSFHHREHREH
jgi:hypothetical protein